MVVNVTFDAKVSKLAGGSGGIRVETASGALTVHAALVQVARSFPSLHLFNCEGELRSILTVTRNEQPVSVRDTLAEGDTLSLAIG